jgi:tellurite resistance protein TerA
MVNLIKDAQAVTGVVSLTKGGPRVVLIKGARDVTATVSWETGTDYDGYALVLLANGNVEHVATFGAKGVPTQDRYRGIRHLGDLVAADVGRLGGRATETIEVKLDPTILAVVPVAYSAQSNGNGSFARYQVSLAVDDGKGTRVEIPAQEANNNDSVYSCVPAIIYNTPDGVVVERVELYSKAGSENRPALKRDSHGNVKVFMDKGPRNDFK